MVNGLGDARAEAPRVYLTSKRTVLREASWQPLVESDAGTVQVAQCDSSRAVNVGERG